MPQYDYDLITIGAGSGGVRASRRAAAMGKRVAIVENLRTGGTCVMRGCVPKKLLVYAGHFADDFEDAAGYGWEAVDPGFDWAKLIAAKNKELDRLEAVYHRILGEAGVEEVFATARVADPRTVEVDGKSLTAETILVATGGWPKMPPIPGIEHVITSNEALDLAELPDRIAIIGGGYIAVEFAGIFNSLGAQVTEIIRAPQILRGFDDDVREALAGELDHKGIDIRRHTEVEEITKDDKAGGGFTLRLKDGGAIDADLVMYATGRAPNTGGMGLEETGVELDGKGAVKVDEFSRSSVDNIYAIGDVTERMNLTPVAIAEAEAMVRTAFGGAPTAVDYPGVPSAVFSQPPIGTVGLTEAQAAELKGGAGGGIDVYVSRFTPMKYSLSGRDEKSLMKLVVERKTGRVLGLHMVGLDAPEIVQGFAVALRCGATKADFDATIGIHPTAAEEFFTLRDKRQ